MLGILEGLGALGPLLDLGVTGVLMVMVWRLMVKKDRKSYEMIEAQNKERRQMYESQAELVREVTEALVDKNNTDDKMSIATTRLAEELREIREILKERNNEAS